MSAPKLTAKPAETLPVQRILKEVSRRIVGQDAMIERLLVGMLTGGHILLEGVPGLAKTLAVRTLAEIIHASFSRIQFTPDLLPADVTGTMVFDQKSQEFYVKKGPLFAQIILADEINRAPAKVQAALLEAMQEHQVTIGGTTYPLEEPFLVLATQNPIENEGTYPLPEAQLDRFMFELHVDYPTLDEEERIVSTTTSDDTLSITPVLTADQLARLQHLVRRLPAPPTVVRYAVKLARSTRPDAAEATADVKRYVSWGAGPRASQYLVLGAKAKAAMDGRSVPDLDDVRSIADSVLRHRVVLNFQGEAEGLSVSKLIRLEE
ncbi:MAG TPA: AAA family ATPase [Gemmatimonadaceae bacterium]|nr:AAA family ATPase [Gemmatimonadaceae bacterium]